MQDKQKIIAQHREGHGNREIAEDSKNHVCKKIVNKYVKEFETEHAKFIAANPGADTSFMPGFYTKRKLTSWR